MNETAARADREAPWQAPPLRDVYLGRTNYGRAINGRDMAASAATASDHLAVEDYESGLVDALANLMHFARRYEIDFAAALDSAEMHHRAEQRFGWDEVPS